MHLATKVMAEVEHHMQPQWSHYLLILNLELYYVELKSTGTGGSAEHYYTKDYFN